jgi:hypothetical protein
MVRLRTSRPVVLALAALLAVSCSPRQVPSAPARHAVPRVAAPGAPPRPASDPGVDAETPRPRVTVDAEDEVLAIVSANLDTDPEEEQVIAVRLRDGIDSPVKVMVADSDSAQGQYYFQSWEAETNATNPRVLDLAVKDLVGDHGREVVVSGMDREGHMTLDVFRASAATPGKALSFRTVCQVVADEITIEESERDDEYALGTKSGRSFPITAYLRDPESDNVMDLVRITYAWKYSDGRYVPGQAEKIPAEKVEQKQLEALFTMGTAAGFEEFLSGSWVQVLPTPAGDRIGAIVDFQPRSRRISISTGDTQEVYVWRDTLRTIYNRVMLIGENESVAKITKTFSVGVETGSSIALSVQASDLGDYPLATYTRATEDIQARLLARSGTSVLLDGGQLEGTYSAGPDLVLEFASPRVTWSEAGKARQGSYAIFTLQGRTILDIRVLGPRQAPAERMAFLADYREKRDAGRAVRTLVLTPVQLTVKGWEESLGRTLTLTQTVVIPKK